MNCNHLPSALLLSSHRLAYTSPCKPWESLSGWSATVNQRSFTTEHWHARHTNAPQVTVSITCGGEYIRVMMRKDPAPNAGKPYSYRQSRDCLGSAIFSRIPLVDSSYPVAETTSPVSALVKRYTLCMNSPPSFTVTSS